jgi:hypothetical protein
MKGTTSALAVAESTRVGERAPIGIILQSPGSGVKPFTPERLVTMNCQFVSLLTLGEVAVCLEKIRYLGGCPDSLAAAWKLESWIVRMVAGRCPLY